jgi:hypothetical protein
VRVFSVTSAIARHPTLWRTALRQGRRLAPPRWWTTRPFLPVPSRAYLRFRALTQYGDAEHGIEPHDVVNYLRWCSEWDRQR